MTVRSALRATRIGLSPSVHRARQARQVGSHASDIVSHTTPCPSHTVSSFRGPQGVAWHSREECQYFQAESIRVSVLRPPIAPRNNGSSVTFAHDPPAPLTPTDTRI